MSNGSESRPEPRSGPPKGWSRSRASSVTERIIEGVLLSCAAVSVLTTAGIIAVLAVETWSFFQEVSVLEFFGETEWAPLDGENASFGVWPLIAGTMLTTVVAILVAVPLGLFAAVYLSEFARPRVRAVLKPALEILAGVPTIVYGYFALVVVTPLLQTILPEMAGFNALSPGIVMGIMIIPMVSSLSEDAIFAVPNSVREGAYGLGASKLSTIFRVVLPTALGGIGASVILALSRAIGETMIVTIAAGQQPNLTADPREAVATMTAYIVQISMGDVAANTIEHKTLFAVGTTLFVITFAMNLISQWLTARFRKGYG